MSEIARRLRPASAPRPLPTVLDRALTRIAAHEVRELERYAREPRIPVGGETEYAIRFSPARESSHPGHRVLYEALAEAVVAEVLTRPRPRWVRDQRFLESGGPDPPHGLLEDDPGPLDDHAADVFVVP